MTTQLLTGRTIAVTAFAVLVGAAGAGSALANGQQDASSCPAQTIVQPFQPWNDSHNYFLAPGGSMESDPVAAGWQLSGGAALTSGSETYDVTGNPADSSSLALPSGSYAISPSVCVTIHDPELRFFARNTGKNDAVLKVTSLFMGNDGKIHSHDLGEVHAGASWTLSNPLKFKDSIQPGPDGIGWVSFVFTPKDTKGNWQIDDLYIDPLKSQ
jgi:hypothetical protein